MRGDSSSWPLDLIGLDLNPNPRHISNFSATASALFHHHNDHRSLDPTPNHNPRRTIHPSPHQPRRHTSLRCNLHSRPSPRPSNLSLRRYLPFVLDAYVDCGASNSIGQKEQIRCRECGHRVMYKKRTNRMGIILRKLADIVQFEAR